MTPKQTSGERAQCWIAAEELMTPASEAAGRTARKTSTETAAAAVGPCYSELSAGAEIGQVFSPRAAFGQHRMLNAVWTGGELSVEDARLDSMMCGLDLSDVRLDKVLRLRQAIASGEYRVSAADVADKLIAAVTSGTGLHERS